MTQKNLANANEKFYHSLPANKMRLSSLLLKDELFKNVPDNWHVIITDIKGSTQAVDAGQHEAVNLIASGSIVTILNIAFDNNITVPFFFGGDGATFLVPEVLIKRLMEALALYKSNTLDNFNLDLRTGTIPVSEIYEAGHRIIIAKFSSSESFSIPVVLGSGLDYAEHLIKTEQEKAITTIGNEVPDLTGMQCRWDKIPPPENKEEIVTLLVVAQNVALQATVFSKILKEIDTIYGSPEKRQPISVGKLKLKTTFNRLEAEMKARLGAIKWLELLRNWIVNWYGYIYFRTKSGKKYLRTLVEMSDTLVIDGKINTVISGNAIQRQALRRILDEMEAKGEIIFGIHTSSASIMSCYVRNLEDSHVHFVDGAEGGYTKASQMLKSQMR